VKKKLKKKKKSSAIRRLYRPIPETRKTKNDVLFPSSLLNFSRSMPLPQIEADMLIVSLTKKIEEEEKSEGHFHAIEGEGEGEEN
jgi:hypothetical protein